MHIFFPCGVVATDAAVDVTEDVAMLDGVVPSQVIGVASIIPCS